MGRPRIGRSAAAWIIGMRPPKWVLLATALVFVVVPGFGPPPVSTAPMAAPIAPPLETVGFGLI